MSPTLTALVAFAAWTALLVFGLANLRLVHARRTKKALNSFTPDGSDLEGLGQRWPVRTSIAWNSCPSPRRSA